MNNPDLIAIGDVATDAFVKLKDAHILPAMDKQARELCFGFGDKIPYESVKVVKGVGNGANVAVAAAKLGVASGLVSDVGDDQFGKECIGSLSAAGVNVDHVRMHTGLESNYHFVLWYDTERTILVKHNAYPYEMPDLSPAPKWIYLSSVAEGAEAYHAAILAWLEAHPETRLAFQPGTFQIKMGAKALAGLYARTEVLFCNADEARRILENEETDPQQLLAGLAALGPKSIVMTDGTNGAYATNGDSSWFVPVFPGEATERTGAGDAFAGAVMAALASGKKLDEALLWGPVNSASVIKYVGAQEGQLTRKELEDALAQAPAEYELRKL